MHGGNAILFIGGNHIEKHIKIAENESLTAISVPTLKIPKNKILLPLCLFKFLSYVVIHRRLIHRLNINAALSMGSFASAPLGFAALSKKIPLFLHEGNSILGDSNMALSKWARYVMLSFPVKNSHKIQVSHQVVGMPVRDCIVHASKASLDAKKKSDMRKELNLNPDLPVLMIFGGSQGAKFINELVEKSIRQIAEHLLTFQIIHLTGKDDNDDIIQLYREKNLNFLVKKEYDDIENLINASDFAICRAGASTIFELAILARCALFIPLPTSKKNHQYENAKIMYEQNAGHLLEQRNCTPEAIIKEITRWIGHKDEYDKMGINAKKLARPHATRDIVDIIIENL